MNTPSPVQHHGLMRKLPWLRWLAITFVILLVLTPVSLYVWRYVVNPCEVEAVDNASTFLETQLNFYDRVYQVATTASRTSLDYPVLTMQQILMDTQELPVPACMRTAKDELINYMETVIRAFRAWGAGEADETIRDLLQQSDVRYTNFRDELKAIDKCAPFCLP